MSKVQQESKPELALPLSVLAEIAPARTLSTMKSADIVDKVFSFVNAVVRTRYMTDEQKAAYEEGVREQEETGETNSKVLEATTIIYAGAGTTIGLRANSLLALRTFEAATIGTPAKAKAAVQKENNEDAYTTLSGAMMKHAEEVKAQPGAPAYSPQFPSAFRILHAEEVKSGVNQVGTETEALAYPMQAYKKFALEDKKRKNDPVNYPEYNVGQLYQDQAFRDSLAGTELTSDKAEAYKTIFIEKIDFSTI